MAIVLVKNSALPADWPIDLPVPMNSGYAIEPVDQVARSNMESGAARTRRRSTARNDHLIVSWVMTNAQLSSFRTWFADPVGGIDGGAAWFNLYVAIGEGGLMSLKEVRFIGTYKANRNGIAWTVSANLEVRD